MSSAIQIQISDEPTSDVVHRFRNFGEDVYRALRDTCTVSIEEIDASSTSFVVRDIHRRYLGGMAVVTLLAVYAYNRRHRSEPAVQS